MIAIKHHKIISFIIGLLFLAVMQEFGTPEPVFRFLLPAFIIYAALATWYNYRYLLQNNSYNFWILIRPLLLLCAGFGLFLIIPSIALRGIFLLTAVAIITFMETILGNLAENLLLNETLITAFGLFLACFAGYFYAPQYEPWYLLAVFLSGSLLARSFYESVPKPDRVKTAGAVAIGLFCAELFWSLNFLQLHFSALSLILFNIFYLCLILNYYHLFQLLNFKKIQFHLFLIVVCSLLVIFSTPWAILPQ
jgi:hypothetical protein